LRPAKADPRPGKGKGLGRTKKEDELSREGDVLDGIMILIAGLGFMVAMWAAVIYGASLFGPR
jgi:hypothetical protein